MRLKLLTVCLIPLLLSACSSVRVVPVESRPVDVVNPDLLPPVRGDRAATQDFPPADSDGYRPPARLAVLLPFTGTLSAAGAGVRDGFLAAYYAETRQRPVVKFYDSQGTAAGAQSAATKAIAEGAQMIVGPLAREEVGALTPELLGRVPMIALNRGSRPPPPGSTGFALLPDDEGRAAAVRLLDRKLASVLVFSNRSDHAQRAVAALRDALRKRGGDVVSEIFVSDDTVDLGSQLSGLSTGTPLPQAVFLALDASQAKTVVAQLQSGSLAGLPKSSTSQILGGGRRGPELDGIEYPELPWLLGQGGTLADPASLSKSLSSARGASQRLFAFGADAWKLAAYFERLYDDPSHTVQGTTGLLRIDVTGPVQRTTSWAVLSGGQGRAVYDARTDVPAGR